LPTPIDLQQLERLLKDGAQLAEALPEEEYNEGHLPGAVSLPLKELTAETAEVLDRGRPVVVYCWDSL
jgi:rhodanese-related sulfurtransferase